MNVTYKAFIDKMEKELLKAKQANSDDEMRGCMFAVKALAELAIEAGAQGKSEEQKQHHVSLDPVKNLGVKRLEDEEANGESIFDF